jgi:hypothetical protein
MASCDLCAERCKYTPTKRQMTVGGALVFVCDDHMKQIMKRQDDAIREMTDEPRSNNADLQQARWVDAKKGNPFTYG